MINFLADESCDFAVVRALRNEGYNVIAVAEVTPAADDEDIIGLAYREAKILLTEDKDFGRLVYAHAHPSGGVILIRFPSNIRRTLPKVILDLVRDMKQRLVGCFVVVEPGHIRINRSTVE